jgi:hypothetical protein
MNSALQYSHTPSTGILFSRFTILNLRFAMPQVPTERTRLRSIFRMVIRAPLGHNLWVTVSDCSSRIFGFRVHRKLLHGRDGGGIDSTTVHYLAERETASLRVWSSVMRASILDTNLGVNITF